ncbi:MAG: hypothetical protein JW981_10370 [Anaerolineae bacterium]|nr:hypothetical protein [Anaerolineae bacterium]
MHRKRNLVLSVTLSLLFGLILSLTNTAIIRAQPPSPEISVSEGIKLPDNYTYQKLDRSKLSVRAATAGLKAVAIVGEVGSSTDRYKQDMDVAVAALQDHGVNVSKFYYGEGSFVWSDIVAAAQDAQFILYMGHGVYGGNAATPDWVGGFYLRSGQFISPDQIRDDLGNGWLAEESIMIFSHACFTAGSSASDPADLSQAEAERRVKMYAEPFVDIGMRSYFANNYFNAAANYVNKLLADIESRDTVGNIFKSTYPNNTANFKDLSYPEPGYDLWLNGTVGNWDHSFVGIPAYTFTGDETPTPKLGGIPETLAFTYTMATGELTPVNYTVTPINTGSDEAITWNLSKEGDWLEIAPLNGSTPTAFNITVDTAGIEKAGMHSGTLNITATAPEGVADAEQQIAVTLNVIVPELGGLPDELEFIYSISEQRLLPDSYRLMPRNTGSEDVLTVEVITNVRWLKITEVVNTITHNQDFIISPQGFGTGTTFIYNGVITVTAVAPTMTLNSPQIIPITLRVTAEAYYWQFLPLIMRNYRR